MKERMIKRYVYAGNDYDGWKLKEDEEGELVKWEDVKNDLTLGRAIVILNELVELDRDAMTDLCQRRVKVNGNGLLEHPTVQCGKHDGEYQVGLLGILNGLFGVREDGAGYLCANFDVVCPDGHEEHHEGSTIHDKCPVCGKDLVLGKILSFGLFPLDERFGQR
jgi:hypothetical protein